MTKETPKLEKFVKNQKSVKKFNSGAVILARKARKLAAEATKRVAIGFGRENEILAPTAKDIVLALTNARKTVGYINSGKIASNKDLNPKSAIGFGRSDEKPGKPTKTPKPLKAKTAIGFGRSGEEPAKPLEQKTAAGFGKSGEKPVKSLEKKDVIGFKLQQAKQR